MAAARELFSTRGYHGTNMRDLAAMAHVSTATLYANFETKVDLLDALIQEALAEAFDAATTAMQTQCDPVARLLAGIRAFDEYVLKDSFLRQVVAYRTVISEVDAQRRGAEIEAAIDRAGTAMIQAAIDAGALPIDDAEALNLLFRLCLQGWVMVEAVKDEPIPFERLFGILETLIRGTAESTR